MRKSAPIAMALLLLVTIVAHPLVAAYNIFSFPPGSTNPYDTLTGSGTILYGTAASGGSSNAGTIFSFNTLSNTITILHSFSGSSFDGADPIGSLTLSGNTLYGTTTDGGLSNAGTIFSFNITSNTITILHSFAGCCSDGADPTGSLTLSNNTLYGMTEDGGSYNYGIIFSIKTNGYGFTILHNFTDNGNDGAYPQFGNLTLSGNLLYGTTQDGGAYGDGTVFSIKTNGYNFAILHSFAGCCSDGTDTTGSLTLSNNTLYGMTIGGGAYDYGTIFSINTTSNTFAILHSFFYSDGAYPDGSLFLSKNILYGMTFYGGSSNYGTIFSFNITSNTITILHNFSYSDGAFPEDSLFLSNNLLYGMTRNGGSSGSGVIFNINITGSNFAVLANFTLTPDGAEPFGSLTLSNNTLYGMTSEGGAYNYGTIFSFNALSNTIAILHSFAGCCSDGQDPQYSNLTLSNNLLYGTTTDGGLSNAGTIFSFNTLSNTITILHSFMGGSSDGANPYGSLTLSGNLLYGMTQNGGLSNAGTIFYFNITSNTFAILHSFSGGNSDGASPFYGSLALSNNTLYGLTNEGGPSNDGTIFSFNTLSNTFAILHSFSGGNSDGASPLGSLTLSGTTLYGMTVAGGSSNAGTIFSFNTLSNTLIVLYSFADYPFDGAYPLSSLALSNNLLYGTTTEGGIYNDGTIFSFNTLSNTFAILHSFSGGSNDGASPEGSLILYGNTLYGMTSEGGAYGYGTIFSLGLDFLNATPNPYALTNNAIEIGQSSMAKTVISNGIGPYDAIWYWSMANIIAGNTPIVGLPLSNNTLGLTINAASQYSMTLTYNDISYIIDANHNVIVKSLQSADTYLGGINPHSSSLIRSGDTLYGLVSSGGLNNEGCGTLISININGTDLETLHNFYSYALGSYSPCDPTGSLALSNNTLYGMTDEGGAYGYGTIFSIKTDGYNFTILHNFTDNSNDGAYPGYSNLTLSGTTLYGTTTNGGSSNYGTVFSIKTNGSGFNLLHSFTDTAGDGAHPQGSLLMIGGTFYGTTAEGGTDNDGTVFSITTGEAFTLLHSFTDSGSDGANPDGSLINSGTTLYGMTSQGGTSGDGIVFSIKTNGNSFTTLHNFAGGSSDGSQPSGSLILSGNTLYGMTYYGGISDEGTIFSMTKSGTKFTILHSFSGDCNNCTDGAYPQGGALYLYNNTLYGMTLDGGEDGDIFSIDTGGSNFVTLANFESAYYGATNLQSSLTASGNILYGLSNSGGASDNYGAIYEMHTNTTGFGILASFNYYDGAYPGGSPTVLNGTIYGMASAGGTYNYGTIFSLAPGSSTITVLHNFDDNGTDGYDPQFGNLTVSGSTLYGMTNRGGIYGDGIIFSINTDGSGYRILKSFNGVNGASPEGSLLLFGNTLYGMTEYGGIDDGGVIFSINKGGSGYSILHNFTCSFSDGCQPQGSSSIAISNNTLYGTTTEGGSENDSGVVFSIKTNGSRFTLLHNFESATDGYALYPLATPTIYGNGLYGTTCCGGPNDSGIVYFMDLNGSNFAVVHILGSASDNYTDSESDGYLIVANGTLYGTTAGGGNYDDGDIYSVKDLGSETIYGAWAFNAFVDDSVGDISPMPSLTNQLVVIPTIPTTTVPQNNGGGGGGSGGSAGPGAGGSGQYLPGVTIANSCAQIVNFTQLDKVTFTLDGQQFNVVENYITPTTAGITINGDSYAIGNGNGISLETNNSFSATLKGISYLPIIQTITLEICGPSTTSVTTVVPPTTTVQPVIVINNTINISKSKPSTFSFTDLNVTVSTNSTASTKSHVTMTNVTLSTPPAPANFTKLYAYNITATNSTNLTIVLHYNCAYANPRPFELVNGAWYAISVYTRNSTTCTIMFTMPSDPIFAIFNPANSTATTSTAPVTTTVSTITTTQPSNLSDYIYAIIAVIGIAAVVLYLLPRRKRRKS